MIIPSLVHTRLTYTLCCHDQARNGHEDLQIEQTRVAVVVVMCVCGEHVGQMPLRYQDLYPSSQSLLRYHPRIRNRGVILPLGSLNSDAKKLQYVLLLPAETDSFDQNGGSQEVGGFSN